jgi:hypothetical protein
MMRLLDEDFLDRKAHLNSGPERGENRAARLQVPNGLLAHSPSTPHRARDGLI